MADDDMHGETRLSRWSRRKHEAREASREPAIVDAPAAEMGELVAPEEAPESPEQRLNREAAEAVDLEALDAESDFSVFMKDGVPDMLRRKAYRILWRSNPVLANVDGLCDYDDDFADASLIMDSFQSAWDVSKGYGVNEEAPEDEDIADAEEAVSEDPSPEEPEPLDEDTDMAEEEAVVVEESHAEAAEEQAEVALADNTVTTEPEPDPLPKVSLRQRLMLDEG